jgi:outer membrane lipoprotein-sorting protein
MRFCRFLLSALLVLGSYLKLNAQEPVAAVARDAQAVSILQAALAALGATPQLKQDSIVASGTYTRFLADSQTVSFPVRVKVLGDKQFRWEVDTPGQGTVVTIVSGTSAWSQTLKGTEAIAVSNIPGSTFEPFPSLFLESWLNTVSTSVQFVGPETIGEVPVVHLSVTPSLGDLVDPDREKRYEATHRRELFVDQKTNLPVQLRYYKHPHDWRNEIPIDVHYSNFQTTGGVAFPLTVTTLLGEEKLTEIQFDSITPNAPVPPTEFAGAAQ